MAYRLKISETPQQALRRIGLAQIERALVALSAANGTGNPVHETRKCLKRIRALLRLMRLGFDEAGFQSENARFRDIGRQLAPARDTGVLSETLLKLEALADEPLAPVLALIKARASERQAELNANATASILEAARQQLETAKAVLAKIKLKQNDFDVIERGLRKGYSRGCANLEHAFTDGTDEALHDFRKSVQLHWRHMALVSVAWPEMFSVRVEAARQLSQILGECQDLAVLHRYIESLAPDEGNQAQMQDVARFVLARRQHLSALAHPRGVQLFCVSPKTLSRTIAESWEAARRNDDRAGKAAAAPAHNAKGMPAPKNSGATASAMRTAKSVKRSRVDV